MGGCRDSSCCGRGCRVDCEAFNTMIVPEHMADESMPDGVCVACELLFELFFSAEQTNRNYWIFTQLFVMLHDGKDACNAPETHSETA